MHKHPTTNLLVFSTEFLQADDAILNAYSEFGATAQPPHEILSQMERFVSLIYKTSDINSTDIIELRWEIVCTKRKRDNNLL